MFAPLCLTYMGGALYSATVQCRGSDIGFVVLYTFLLSLVNFYICHKN
jgi:hypothetical protein